MSEFQTEEEFREHLNTRFRVQVNASKPIDLTLVAVESRPSEVNEEQGMERFSVFFTSSPDVLLPQGIYRVAHSQMGEFDLFLVPVAQDAHACRYEAIYNYYKSGSGGS